LRLLYFYLSAVPKLLGHTIPVRRDDSAIRKKFDPVGRPIGRESVVQITLVFAGVGRQIVPVQQNNVAMKTAG